MQVRIRVDDDRSYLFLCPRRANFTRGRKYTLKLTSIPLMEGVELYPTIELAPLAPASSAFLIHGAVPVQFAEEDFDEVLSGNLLTKVIYLPSPESQEMVLAGVESLVSTRLDPGVNPIIEAKRHGTILAVVRLGNRDPLSVGAQRRLPCLLL